MLRLVKMLLEFVKKKIVGVSGKAVVNFFKKKLFTSKYRFIDRIKFKSSYRAIIKPMGDIEYYISQSGVGDRNIPHQWQVQGAIFRKFT